MGAGRSMFKIFTRLPATRFARHGSNESGLKSFKPLEGMTNAVPAIIKRDIFVIETNQFHSPASGG